MPMFKDLKSLTKHLNTKINNALEKECLEEIKAAEKEAIERSVYSSYRPRVYDRRRDYDFENSLANEDNIKGEIVGDGKLIVKNETKVDEGYGTSNSGYLAPIIKSGQGYDYQGDGDGAYLKPRNFEREAVIDLEISGNLNESIKKGLRRQGLSIK